MATDFLFIFSYLNSPRIIDREGFRPREFGRGNDGRPQDLFPLALSLCSVKVNSPEKKKGFRIVLYCDACEASVDTNTITHF